MNQYVFMQYGLINKAKEIYKENSIYALIIKLYI